MRLTNVQLCPLFVVLTACALNDPAEQDDNTAGTGSGTPLAGSSSTSGASTTGGSAPTAGAAAVAGSSSGGTQAGPSAGTGTGGSAVAGTGGSSSAGSAAGGSGNGGGGSGNGGSGGSASSGGSAGAGGSAGGAAPTGVSGLPVPPGNANVPKPSGTGSAITVVHWAGFKGAVSYSFDDDNTSQIQNYTQLNALGVRFTFFMWTGKNEANNAIWKTAVKDGHEIANHTKSHTSNGTGDDIDQATTFIKSTFGIQPWSMAAPNGAAVYSSLTKGRFFINRGVANALIGPGDNSDPFTLPTYIPPTGASTAAFNTEVDNARSAGKWKTMCIHGFTGDGAAYQPVPVDNFIESVKHAKSTGDMWIDTITNVGAYWLGEKAFNAATTMTSGTDKTWTWKLPDKFPTGHYLRVTVAGGTLKQGGATLTWDPHGYYEVALDAGSVTLSP